MSDTWFVEEWVQFPSCRIGDVVRVRNGKKVWLFGRKARVMEVLDSGLNNMGQHCYFYVCERAK